MRQSCYGHSPQQLSLPQQRVISDVTNSVGRLEVLCHAGSTCTIIPRGQACLPGSQSQNSNRLMLPAQLSLGVKACFTGNQSEDSNRLMLPAQLSHGVKACFTGNQSEDSNRLMLLSCGQRNSVHPIIMNRSSHI